MYLVPAADYDAGRLHSQPPPPVKTKRVTKRNRTANQLPHDKWVALRTKLLEADINEAGLIHRFSDFLRMVLPQLAPQTASQSRPSTAQRPKIETVEIAATPQQSLVAQRPELLSAGVASTSYEVSKRRPSSVSDAAETSDDD